MSEKIKSPIGVWLGDTVKARRSERSLSQQDVSDAVGVSRAQIANIESGFFQVSVETLMEISEFLDISLDELRGRYRPSDRKKKKLIEHYRKKIKEIEAR